MNLTDLNDPVSMGRYVRMYVCMYVCRVIAVSSCHGYRQLLELQKLRRKAKKVVDTRASKGRKIRLVVSWLIGFTHTLFMGLQYVTAKPCKI